MNRVRVTNVLRNGADGLEIPVKSPVFWELECVGEVVSFGRKETNTVVVIDLWNQEVIQGLETRRYRGLSVCIQDARMEYGKHHHTQRKWFASRV
jgi:hypothetical protein